MNTGEYIILGVIFIAVGQWLGGKYLVWKAERNARRGRIAHDVAAWKAAVAEIPPPNNGDLVCYGGRLAIFKDGRWQGISAEEVVAERMTLADTLEEELQDRGQGKYGFAINKGAQTRPDSPHPMHDIPCHCDKCEKALEDALNDPEFVKSYEEQVGKSLPFWEGEEEAIRNDLRAREGGL